MKDKDMAWTLQLIWLAQSFGCIAVAERNRSWIWRATAYIIRPFICSTFLNIIFSVSQKISFCLIQLKQDEVATFMKHCTIRQYVYMQPVAQCNAEQLSLLIVLDTKG